MASPPLDITRSINVALAGASGIAETYAPILKRQSGVSLTTVYSRDRNRAKAFADRFDIARATDDLSDLTDGVDAVLICTEPSRHVFLARTCVDRGIPVLVEKPLSHSLEGVDDLIAACKRTGTLAGVVSQWRFDPHLRRIRDKLRGADEPAVWAQVEVFKPCSREYFEAHGGWRLREGHVPLNQGIHWLDILIWILGEPREIRAYSETLRASGNCRDFAAGMLVHESGTVSTVIMSTGHKGVSRLTLRILQRGKEFVFPARLGPAFLTRFSCPSRVNHSKLVLQDFLAAVREGRPPAVSLEEGRMALKAALAFL